MLLCLQLACRVGSPGRTVTHKVLLITSNDKFLLFAQLLSQTSGRHSVRAREGGMQAIRAKLCAYLSRLSTPTWGRGVWRILRHSFLQLIKNLSHSTRACQDCLVCTEKTTSYSSGHIVAQQWICIKYLIKFIVYLKDENKVKWRKEGRIK